MISVVSVTPSVGLTGGRELVDIIGLGFDLVGEVTVKFGTVPAFNVRVITATRLDCQTPNNNVGVFDVTVENVDLAEIDTLAGAYTYGMPDLAAPSSLTLATEALALLLLQQVLADNVVIRTTHPDYHDGVGPPASQNRATDFSEVPQIVLKGPDMIENTFDRCNEDLVIQDLPNDTFIRRPEVGVWDLMYDIVIRDDNKERMGNIIAQLLKFFRLNIFLPVQRDANDPSKGTIDYELYLMDRFTSVTSDKEDLAAGIITQQGICKIRAVRVEIEASIDQGVLIDPEDVDTEIGSI